MIPAQAATGPAQARARPAGRRELWLRLASGLVLGALVLWALGVGGWPFAGIWLAAGIVGAAEWIAMTRTEPREGLYALVAATLAALLLSLRGGAPPAACLAVLLLGAAACATVARTARGRMRALLGVLCAAVVAAVPVALRDDPGIGIIGPAWMFSVVWSTDISAYFAGRRLGGPKLLPRVSPRKTWSGALGGLLGAVAAGTLLVAGFGYLAPGPLAETPLPLVAGASALASVLSQAGDLVESWLKRRHGVKDSGRIIPGHGGVMDRLDGFFAVAMLAGLYLAWRGSGLLA